MDNPVQPRVTKNHDSFKIFHELMAKKVSNILLVSSPYDAFILEEEGRLAQRIILEYRGLNLSRPPRIHWAATAKDAFAQLKETWFDFVITTPRVSDMAVDEFSQKLKELYPNLPVYLLSHNASDIFIDLLKAQKTDVDKLLVWSGNADLLLALIKNQEDCWNIDRDTDLANVRVIIFVEDSPYYFSYILPLLYKEIVSQTQFVMEDSLNEDDRLLRMRARPKILVAETYEEAVALYQQYKPYVLSVLSDVRFPLNGSSNAEAGVKLLSLIKDETPDIPLLMLSNEEHNRKKAAQAKAAFINKNSSVLYSDIHRFFAEHLGFGDFIFRAPDGLELKRAANLREMELALSDIPESSFKYHASHNHFSTWLMARSEIHLATQLRPINISQFDSYDEMKAHLIKTLRARRTGRQRGVITDFHSGVYDATIDFVKIGNGSLGGKARGLAFMTTQLRDAFQLHQNFEGIDIYIPKTVVISTEGFDAFIDKNNLGDFSGTDLSDAEICTRFLEADFPEWLSNDLTRFLTDNTNPLAVRSSSLLEDAYFQPYAGIYRTYMIPNSDALLTARVEQLIQTIKLVYASTFLKVPRSFAKSTQHRTEDEKMAVVIQELAGYTHQNYFYPYLSGVAQSYNFYPVAAMKADEGIAHIALGLGKIVMEGGNALRFSPHYPKLLPQFSTVDDILKNAQRYFYALKLKDFPLDFITREDATLAKLDIDDAEDHPAIRYMASTFEPQDNRIRDGWRPNGYPVITFARMLKHNEFPLSEILTQLLELGQKGMGGPVELEFCVNPAPAPGRNPSLALVQIRPMAMGGHNLQVNISDEERETAALFCHQALGSSRSKEIYDIVFVKPDDFDTSKTMEMVTEIGRMNALLEKEGRKYLLVGPGRWGSSDRWLGIPVSWNEISSVDAMVETTIAGLNADPSQGSHFFHNITSLGIGYLTIRPEQQGVIDWDWFKQFPAHNEKTYIRHIRLKKAALLKIDGRSSMAILIKPAE